MKLLALETATEACSAALYLDGQIHERYTVAPRGHAGLILPMVDGLLAEAGMVPGALDAVTVGRGPGSFTGVRIAAGVAQGIAFGADLPVVPVSTLAVLAQGAVRELETAAVLAAIDARMEEVYWGAFRADGNGCAAAVGEERVCPAAAVPVPDGEGWTGAGTGWGPYEAELTARLGGRLAAVDAARLPRARDLAVLGAAAFQRGEGGAPEQAIPVYLRDRVVRPPV